MGLYEEAAEVYVDALTAHTGVPGGAVAVEYMVNFAPFRAVVEHVAMVTRQAMAKELNTALDELPATALPVHCHDILRLRDGGIELSCSKHGTLIVPGTIDNAEEIAEAWYAHVEVVDPEADLVEAGCRGLIGVDPDAPRKKPERWMLTCVPHGQIGHRPLTPQGHDEIVALWKEHTKAVKRTKEETS